MIRKTLVVLSVALVLAAATLWLRSWWVDDWFQCFSRIRSIQTPKGPRSPGPAWALTGTLGTGQISFDLRQDTNINDGLTVEPPPAYSVETIRLQFGRFQYHSRPVAQPNSVRGLIDSHGFGVVLVPFRGLHFTRVAKAGYQSVTLEVPAIYCIILLGIYPVYGGVRWWRDSPRRRRSRHQCPSCGYELRGNVSGVCPECAVPLDRGRDSDQCPS